MVVGMMQASNQYDHALSVMQSISRCLSEMMPVSPPEPGLEGGPQGSLGQLVDERLFKCLGLSSTTIIMNHCNSMQRYLLTPINIYNDKP